MRNKRCLFPYLVLIPVMLVLVVFIIAPIIGSFLISLFDYNPLRAQNLFTGIANYLRLFRDGIFYISLSNTLKYVIVMVSLNLVITLIVAQIISQMSSNKVRSIFRSVFFMPCVATRAATSIVWMLSIFPTQGGMLNILGKLIGMPAVSWLGNANILLTSIIIYSLWADIILFIAGIDGIPNEFYEAAEIDGAGAFYRFIRITLPLLGRTFSFVLAMTLISQFQAFVQFSILAPEGGASYSGQVLSTMIYSVGFQQKNMGYASSVSVVLFIIILTVTVIQQRVNRVDWGY
jgi:multiple sugar transport system permease protein